MEYVEHIQEMLRTEESEMHPVNSRLLHAAMGCATEVGELIEAILKNTGNDNLKEEFGDMLWYIALAVQALDIERCKIADAADEDYISGSFTHQVLLSCNSISQVKLPSVKIQTFLLLLSKECSDALDLFKCGIFYNAKVDQDKLEEVFGNIFYLTRKALMLCGFKDKDLCQINADKLRTRYKEGFSEEEAQNRDLDAEKDAISTTKTITEEEAAALTEKLSEEALDGLTVVQLRGLCEIYSIECAKNARKADIRKALAEYRDGQVVEEVEVPEDDKQDNGITILELGSRVWCDTFGEDEPAQIVGINEENGRLTLAYESDKDGDLHEDISPSTVHLIV